METSQSFEITNIMAISEHKFETTMANGTKTFIHLLALISESMVEVIHVRGYNSGYTRLYMLYKLQLKRHKISHVHTFKNHFEVVIVSEDSPQTLQFLNWLKGTIPPGKKVNL